ncbi:MAG: flagellar biosynthesis repressor FlbT [Hyphomicrobium sp.]
MKKSFKVYLKAGERLFVNGAVLRVDRKVSVEFLNDVAFLLEGNVLQAEEATTPLRQLYFVVQAMLIDAGRAAEARNMYEVLHANFMKTFTDEEILEGLCAAKELAGDGRLYDALKTIRTLFAIEDQLVARKATHIESQGATPSCR